MAAKTENFSTERTCLSFESVIPKLGCLGSEGFVCVVQGRRVGGGRDGGGQGSPGGVRAGGGPGSACPVGGDLAGGLVEVGDEGTVRAMEG